MNSKSLNSFAKEFIFRHEFNDSDINVLKSKNKNIKFQNIPKAWIVIIDSMLSKIKSKIKLVSQHCGFLVVDWMEQPNQCDLDVIKIAEYKLYQADYDLHKRYFT
jgi:hypothetical protein